MHTQSHRPTSSMSPTSAPYIRLSPTLQFSGTTHRPPAMPPSFICLPPSDHPCHCSKTHPRTHRQPPLLPPTLFSSPHHTPHAPPSDTITQTSADTTLRWTSISGSSDGSKLAATAWSTGIYVSSNGGSSWTQSSAPAMVVVIRGWGGTISCTYFVM